MSAWSDESFLPVEYKRVVRNVNDVSQSVKVKEVVIVGVGQVVIAKVITMFLAATKYIEAEDYNTEFRNIKSSEYRAVTVESRTYSCAQ